MKELGNQVKSNSNDGIYNVKQLGLSKTILLGFQHTFAMFGATVLVPILTGLSVSTTLLMAGLGTLLFHLLTKGKVPAFLGSSFAFLGGYAAVAPLKDGVADPTQLAYACGGVFVAGFLYLIVAGLIYAFGAKKVMRFFPPVVTGPIIIAIGLTLAPTAINNCNSNWTLAIVAVGIVIVCNIWGKGMVKIIPIMLGIVGSYIVALCMGEIDFTAVKEAAWIGVPLTTANFAKFDISAIVTIVPIALATMMEHIGDISAIGATTGKNYIANPGLHRTLLGDGLATSLSALFGGPANTTYGENTGVLALSKVYDPLVMQIAAGIAVVLSFSPKFAAIVRTVPTAIIGGVSLILYGMISAIGVRNVVENAVDFTKSRNLIVAAVILVSALGIQYQYVFNEAIGANVINSGISFNIGNFDITLSGIAVAALAGIILNAILPGKDYEFNEE
ncbi:uracil-xanthine permease family protein [Anaerosporobacter faecicola]|uniref:uracil-xanthine permease family protein n=1 Tax=Anaerosporobacter faecicola TaxID=2718714 RepID=UPI00143B46B4|nr:uracil-xanthine permease family protein [Anaerosporobacter faecicola]